MDEAKKKEKPDIVMIAHDETMRRVAAGQNLANLMERTIVPYAGTEGLQDIARSPGVPTRERIDLPA